MAVISIQRHMLIFNGQVLRIRQLRILLYNLPLLFCLIYPVSFYFYAVILYPCDGSQWYYEANGCGFAVCYIVYNSVLGMVDWSINNGFPMIVNTLANILLLVRVIKQKRRHQTRATWRKQQRMTKQLFYISSLYIIAWTPSLIIGLIQTLDYSDMLFQMQSDYFLDLTLLVCLLLPWVCLGLLPKLRKFIGGFRTIFQMNNTVAPF